MSGWGLDEASRQFMLMRYAWLRRRVSEGWLDKITVSTVPRATLLHAHGIFADYVPFGYHSTLGGPLALDRDVDVVFLGRAKIRRRQRILEGLEAALARCGRTLQIVEAGCFGPARTEMLNRARVSLNLTNYPWEVPGIRFLMSMACGALVVSENVSDSTPFREGEHFASAQTKDLSDVVLRFLDNEAERRRLVDTARDFVTRDLTLSRSVDSLLDVRPVCSEGAAG